MFVTAAVIWVTISKMSDGVDVMITFLGVLGAVMLALGGIMIFGTLRNSAQDQDGNKKSLKERVTSSLSLYCLPGLFFPLLLPFSPIIFIIIKIMGLVKPNNQFLKAQSTIGSRGESILEAAPQFGLQCYVVFLSLTPLGCIKWISITTSVLTLSLTNIEHYVTAREVKLMTKMPREPKNTDFKGLNDLELKTIDTFGPMSILKNIAIFLPQSLFKCDSISTNDHVRPDHFIQI